MWVGEKAESRVIVNVGGGVELKFIQHLLYTKHYEAVIIYEVVIPELYNY